MYENKEVIKSSFKVYKRYYLRAVLLEIFGKNKPLDNENIKGWLLLEVRKTEEMYHSVKMSQVVAEFEYLANIGYFKLVENGTKITLSEVGIKALQECIWEGLASSAFFSYKSIVISSVSLDVSNNSLKISKIACWITGFAMLFAAASFVVALCK